MDYFLIAYIYVVVFSAYGIYYGSSAKSWSKRKYTVVLSIVGALILFRLMLNYVPKTELIFKDINLYGYFSFYWLMPPMALLLTIAYHHMPVSRRSIYLGFGCLPFVIFLMTVYKSYTYDFKELKSSMPKRSYCMQSTGFTCGPATGATVLSIFDIDSSEMELAIKGKTTSLTGMNEFLLKNILNEKFKEKNKKLKAVVKSYDAITEEDKKNPIIVTIKLNFLTAHWIVQLSENKKRIKCFDPLKGIKFYTSRKINSIARSHCIVFEKI
ncbi:MAG: hypothetical protein COA79_01595 [Planctomycetota bacterium]|nr:MAG: hypothetical protein COA79_01595 [Planctomycetota bacterium]